MSDYETTSEIGSRKDSHLAICAERDVEHRRSTLLDQVHLLHDSLPELAISDVDLSVEFFGRRLQAPIVISGMSGGTDNGRELNRAMATAAQKFGLAMGVGSQRAMLVNPDTASLYLRGLADYGGLSSEDQIRFTGLMTQELNRAWKTLHLHQ